MANAVIFYDVGYVITPHNEIHKEQLHNYIPSVRPVGPYRIANEIKNNGLSCQVIKNFITFSFEELEQICNKFIDRETLIVGFSSTFWDKRNLLIIKRLELIIKLSKNINPKIKIIIGGGSSINIVQDKTLNIDAAMLGYAEHTFNRYLNSLINKKSDPFPSRIIGSTKIYDYNKHLDDFDFQYSKTTYDKFDIISPNESLMLEVGRGCIFNCKFCSFPLNGKKKFDYVKNFDTLREELISNYNTWNISSYVISDDTFNDSDEKIKQLHSLFTSLPFKIKFSAYLRLDLLNKYREHIPLLAEMGLKGAFFGVETFNERAARTIGKGIIPSIAQKLLFDLKNIYWKDQVKIQIGLIVGLPYETFQSYNNTIDWILDNDYCLVDRISVFPLSIINPKIPTVWKSPFQESASKYGFEWLTSNVENWINLDNNIKSFKEAEILSDHMREAVKKTDRDCYGYGGHGMLINSDRTLSYFEDQRSFEEQLKMSRYEYVKWFEKEKTIAAVKQILHYKNKILSI